MIWEKAKELGRLIGQSEEYRALRRSEASLRDDTETVAKLDAIKSLANTVDQLVARGEQPGKDTIEAYETAVRDLETSSTGQAYVVARANFDKLMMKVNQHISEGIDVGATSNIITL